MSPLGDLYRQERERLARRYPTLDPRRLDGLVALALARAFLDLSAAELAGAIRESRAMESARETTLTPEPAGDGADQLARAALEAAAAERRESAG